MFSRVLPEDVVLPIRQCWAEFEPHASMLIQPLELKAVRHLPLPLLITLNVPFDAGEKVHWE